MLAFRDALRLHQERLNRLNVYPVPDGDTGTNMALTLESVVKELEASGGDDMVAAAKAIAHGSLMGARGNSGVILSQVLRGLCQPLAKEGNDLDAAAFAGSLVAASEAAYSAVMKPVEGTILTVAREAAAAADRAAAGGASLAEVVDAAGEAARATLERTPELLPVLAQAGVVDAGGAGFVLLLDAIAHVVAGRPLPDPGDLPASQSSAAVESVSEEGDQGAGDGHPEGPRYEVMYLLEAPDEHIEGFKEQWSGLGDSIVVVGGDGLWNCHVHTDSIGPSIEAGIAVGRPRDIRVTDLYEQVGALEAERSGPGDQEAQEGDGRRVATAVVAVGAGEGVAAALRQLGAHRVVAGGQCMNPSTAEMLDAVEATAADAVVVLPNNENVLPAAGQVPALASKPVHVVPTRNIAEGAAALLAYDPDAGAEDNARAMAEAASAVVSGEVTRAVRDARTPVGDITEGDHLGIAGDDVVVVRRELVDAACSLLERLVGPEHELVTVIEGEGAAEADTERIRSWLAEHRPSVAFERQDWGHPISPYLFSIE